ncbi:MAG TPA: M14 family metallopeptidase [Bacteroidota bacterium]
MPFRPMTRTFRVFALLCLMAPGLHAQALPPGWQTPYELSGGLRTPRYPETIAFCRRLAAASPWVHYASFGVSPQGRELPLLIVSRDGAFDPVRARRSGKPVVLIQSGIHAGEIDGKDATLMLVRDLSVRKMHRELLDHAILLVVPIFNVDGHERFGPRNRINQNGPLEMGWRVTAQNLNLNRDYMKADAPEMRAMLRLFTAWLPDLLVDCHVTDGIDFQYDITYSVEPGGFVDSTIARWMTARLIPAALRDVEAAGHKIFPYVAPREDNDLSKGLLALVSTPRFSTGYAAIQNRPAVLIETHMLKPYHVRVEATYAMLTGLLKGVNGSADELRRVVAGADRATVRAGSDMPRPFLPLRFGLGPASTSREFLAIESRTEPSAVSGAMRTIYTGKPVTRQVPYYDQVTVEDSARIPFGYAVPPEWSAVIGVLHAHGITWRALRVPLDLTAESYRFREVKFQQRPYEGRHAVTFSDSLVHEHRTLPAGTVIVPTAQRAGRVLVNLLEPGGPDALVGWGFFDAIFEQKEYAEDYVMETVADTLLRDHPALRTAFEDRVKNDSAFAKSPGARLNWLYQRSPWRDSTMNAYPVVRLTEEGSFREAMRRAR